MIIDLHVPICPPSSMLYIQLPRLVSGLHCGYGKLSCSGQKRITIFDISQGTLTKLSVNYTFAVGYCNKIVYTVSLPLITVERVQPVCMTFKNNNVNEICKKCFVLHEWQSLVSLSSLQSYMPAHQDSLTCVFHNLGMVASGSRDGTVAIHSPAPGHTHITTLQNHKADITGLDCSLGSLAISSSDLTVSLWTTNYL